MIWFDPPFVFVSEYAPGVLECQSYPRSVCAMSRKARRALRRTRRPS